MNIGIIGYGSMGRMIAGKLAASGMVKPEELHVSNRSFEKIQHLKDRFDVCVTNSKAAVMSDILFICVRPVDMKAVLRELRNDEAVHGNTLVVSLNGSISFQLLEKYLKNKKIAKVIPSVTAEIDRSQTLVCYNDRVGEKDKETLEKLLSCMGNVTELPENELGMGSELVSCMPGFIAAVFDVICSSAKKHTSIPEKQIIEMVLNTLTATGELMTEKDMTFDDVVSRVATKGGITEEGTKVIYEKFPQTADEMFDKTLEKRAQTARNAEESFK